MAYFCVHAIDHPGQLERRSELRPEHRQRLRQHGHSVIVHIGGPLLDMGGAMTGTMLVIEAEDRAAVERYLAGDPYVEAGIFKTIEIHAFAWGLGQPEMSNG